MKISICLPKHIEPTVPAFVYCNAQMPQQVLTQAQQTEVAAIMQGEVKEVISRAAVESGNYILCVIQEAAGILGSIACACMLVKAYMNKEGKKKYLKILALFGLVELAVYILPYLYNALAGI